MPSEWSHVRRLEPAHDEEVTALAFSPVTLLLASASWDKAIHLWNARTGEKLHPMTGHGSEVTTLAFAPSPVGHLLASASFDGTCRLWETTTGTEMQCLDGRDMEIADIALSPDGGVLAVASRNLIKLWNTLTGNLKLEIDVKDMAKMVISPRGDLLASITDSDKTVRLWDLTTGVELRNLVGHTAEITALSYSPDGHVLASTSRDRTIRLWDTTTRRIMTTKVERYMPQQRGDAQVTGVKPPERQRLASFPDGQRVVTVKPESRGGAVRAVAWSPNGQMLATGSENAIVRLWNATMSEVIHTLEGHEEGLRALYFSQSGEVLVSVAGDQEVRIWNTISGKEIHQLEDYGRVAEDYGGTTAVGFSPAGEVLVAMSDDKTVVLLRLTNSEGM